MTQRPDVYNGTRLKMLINSQGIRQDWLAERSGISRAHLSRIVNGKRMASHEVAERIAAALRVPLFLAFELPIGSETLPNGIEEEAA